MSKRQRVVATATWEQREIRGAEEDMVRGSVALDRWSTGEEALR